LRSRLQINQSKFFASVSEAMKDTNSKTSLNDQISLSFVSVLYYGILRGSFFDRKVKIEATGSHRNRNRSRNFFDENSGNIFLKPFSTLLKKNSSSSSHSYFIFLPLWILLQKETSHVVSSNDFSSTYNFIRIKPVEHVVDV